MGQVESKVRENEEDVSVMLWPQPNYQGKPSIIKGEKNIKWIEDLGFPNDQLSSLIVPDGYSVTLFSDSDYKGDSKVFTGQVPYVGDDFDKKTSSLKVTSTQNSLAETGSGMTILWIILILILVGVGIWLYKRGQK